MYRWQEDAVRLAMPLCVSDMQKNAARDIILAVNKYKFPAPSIERDPEYPLNIVLDWQQDDRRWTVNVDCGGCCAERFQIPDDLRGNTIWYRDEGFTLAMRQSAMWLINGTPAFQNVAS